jgi:hypothetical protein
MTDRIAREIAEKIGAQAMAHELSTEKYIGAERGPRLNPELVWREIAKASFAVVSYVTPDNEPRSSGVVYGTVGHHLYIAIAPDGWKARHIADGQQVSVTVPIRRGNVLSLLAPIPPATVSFHATATVHPAGSLDLNSVSRELASLVPDERRAGSILELVPEGTFLTYGVGVSLMDMRNPTAARAHVPVM